MQQQNNQPNFSSASLYVGDLAPDVSEAKLFEIFNSVGPVTSIRVCRDAIRKQSLGYAYVNFHHHDDADRALETLNFTQINNRPCRIMWSQRDPSLRKSGVGNVFVKHLPAEVSHKELMDVFSVFGSILSCKVAMDREGNSKGYGYVHFEQEEAAKEAVENSNDLEILGQRVEVVPYEKRERRQALVEWTNLYVKNIPPEMTEADFTAMFQQFGEITSMKIMTVSEDDVARDQARAKPYNLELGKSKGFGFVNYATHEAAKAAADALSGKEVGPPPTEGAEPRKLYVGRAVKKDERHRELKKKFDAMNANKPTGLNLYVKNLDDTITDTDLHSAFEKFGTITSARVMRHLDGSSKGFGFVSFSAAEEANAASTEMMNQNLGGKPIYVAFAVPREQRRAMLAAGRGQMGRGVQMNPMYSMPMMYQAMGRGGNPYMPPMMMAPPRGMARGAGGPMPFARPPYQMPIYANMGVPPQGQQQQRGANRRQTRGAPRQGGRQPTGQRQPQPQGQQQNIKFNTQARNQPQAQDSQAPAQPAVPQVPAAQPTLTAATLAAADEASRKNMLGEQLYPLISKTQPEQAGKITGMLLEMDNSELLHLIESPESLQSKIVEALEVLRQHQEAQGH